MGETLLPGAKDAGISNGWARRQISHGALCLGYVGDVRRGFAALYGNIAAQYFSYDLYDKNAHKDKGAFGSTFMVAGAAQRYSALGGVANARPDLFGAELAAFMKRAARGYTRLTAFAEEMPVIENRIELASDKDEFGMPFGKITHGFNDEAVALLNANFDKGVEIAKATGAKDVWPNKGPMPTIHPWAARSWARAPLTL